MINYDILKKLRDELPRGAASTIRDRLLKKGFDFTVSYINLVLNPDDPRKRSEIIEEAILVRDEYIAHLSEIEQRILHPQS